MSIDEQIEILKQALKSIHTRILTEKAPADSKEGNIREIVWALNQVGINLGYKPEPSLIPWTAEDVPMPICWVRHIESKKEKYFVSCVSDSKDSIVITYPRGSSSANSSIVNLKALFYHYEHSTDGKTWKHCGKVK